MQWNAKSAVIIRLEYRRPYRTSDVYFIMWHCPRLSFATSAKRCNALHHWPHPSLFVCLRCWCARSHGMISLKFGPCLSSVSSRLSQHTLSRLSWLASRKFRNSRRQHSRSFLTLLNSYTQHLLSWTQSPLFFPSRPAAACWVIVNIIVRVIGTHILICCCCLSDSYAWCLVMLAHWQSLF